MEQPLTISEVQPGLWFELQLTGDDQLAKYRVRSRVRGGRNGQPAWTCDRAIGTAGFCRTPEVLTTATIVARGVRCTPAW